MKPPSFKRMNLRHELVLVTERCGPKGMSVEVLLKNSGTRGHALITLLLSIPFVLPIPLPGLSTPFGILVSLLGLAIALNREPYLPRRIKNVVIPSSVLHSTIGKFNDVMDKIDWLIGPRLAVLAAGGRARRAHGVLICLAGLLLALPAPPGGNVGPAVAVILFSIAILEEDGVLTLLGAFVLLLSTAVMAGLWYGLWESVKKLLQIF